MLKHINISVTILTVLGLFLYVGTPLWSFLLVLAVWGALTTIGSFHIRWNYHLKSLHSNSSIQENWVALTFDDGPHPSFTPQVLSLLKKHNAKASFFCIGKNIESYPDLVKRISEEGHTIGNHTYSHSTFFGFFGKKRVKTELNKTNHSVYSILQKHPLLYRPAFGVTNPSIKTAVRLLGLSSIGWSVRSLDTTARSEEQIVKRSTCSLQKGDIVLLHDTSEKSVAVLERLLLYLESNNLRSVTVDQLLHIDAYA